MYVQSKPLIVLTSYKMYQRKQNPCNIIKSFKIYNVKLKLST